MKKGLSMRNRHYFEGYSFILIWIIGFFIFMALPLGKSLYYAFQDLKITTEGLKPTFIGLRHFRDAFTIDVEFPTDLISTVGAMLLQVPLILIFSIFSAILLNRNFIGRGLFRGIFFLPVIITSGAVLQKLRDSGAETLPIFTQYNLFTKLSDIIPPQILLPLLQTLDSLTVVMWDSGVQILIFLAGLQSISLQLYEAAKCDGATPWESFWKITFPMIMPMIFVNTLFTIVNSFTKADNLVMTYIQTVFKDSNYGYASALGWIYFLISFVLIGFVFFIFRKNLTERG
jgi:oligogalacturonide transport system permease protein